MVDKKSMVLIVLSYPNLCNNLKWEVGSGKQEVGSGKWEVGSGKREAGSGKWEVGAISLFREFKEATDLKYFQQSNQITQSSVKEKTHGALIFKLLQRLSSTMKNLRISLLVILSAVVSLNFIACSGDHEEMVNADADTPDPDLEAVSLSHSMKGWELYSWPNGNDWNHSILEGTNRLKTYEEVTANPIVVSGSGSLKKLLDKLPKNENISWIGKGWLKKTWEGPSGNISLPDNKTIHEIKEHCAEKSLVLNIVE